MSPTRVKGTMRFVIPLAILLGAGVAGATKEGDRASDFSLVGLDGKTVKLSSLKGNVVVLDFWASWCGPCKKELPALDAMAKRYAGDGKKVVVLAVNVDRDRANAEKFLGTAKVSALTVLLDPSGKVAAAYDLPTMPSSYVIDAKGLIKKAHAGFSSGDEKKIAAEVDAALGE